MPATPTDENAGAHPDEWVCAAAARGRAISDSPLAAGRGVLAGALAFRREFDVDEVLLILEAAPVGASLNASLAWAASVVASHPPGGAQVPRHSN